MSPPLRRRAAAFAVPRPGVVRRRAAVLACALMLPAAAPGAEEFHRGMTLGLFSRTDPAAIEADLDRLGEIGVTSVSLVVPRVVPHVRSLEIGERPGVTPSDDALRIAIRGAHARSMRVMLLPILFLEDVKPGEWRGTLDPPDWDAWFRVYGDVIRHYATMAEAEGVELLSVGSELCSAESRAEAWRRLIDSVREVYRGKVLYSANWDHFRDIPFLTRLDYVGVNAYYQLSEASRPSVEDLRRSWEPIREDLRAWSRRNGRPLLFTEVGYPSRQGAAHDPWDHTAERPVDLELQRRCYRAFIEAWRDIPELAGVFFYLWWGEGGAGDDGYTPRGKPAEQELAGWFRDAGEERDPCCQSEGISP